MSACPHCGAVARLEPSAALRWRCGVCGGPVVPTEGDAPRSHPELGDLVAAQRLRAMAVGWTAAAIVLGVVAVMTGGLALLVWLASHAAALVLGLVAAGFGVLSLTGRRRARRHDGRARQHLEQAWEKAAGEVLAARRDEMTAPQLASAMHTDEGHAEALLGRLSAHGRARVDVRDDAELAYRITDAEALAEADEEAAAPDRPRLRAR